MPSEPTRYRLIENEPDPIPPGLIEFTKVGLWFVPVEPDYEAAWKAWKATGNIEDAVDAALGIGDTDA